MPGRLLLDSNNQRTQKIFPLHIRQRNVQISVPTIRTLISPMDIHQSPRTRHCFTEETGTTSDYLPRRPTVDASGQKRTNSIIQRSMHTVQRPGLHHQERKMLNDVTPIHCLPWCSFEFGQHDNGSTSPKLQDLQYKALTIKEKEANTIQELSSILGQMTRVSKIGLTTAPLHYRALQQQYIKAVHRYGIMAWKNLINLTSEALADLHWWTFPKLLDESSTPIVEATCNITMGTDASSLNWRAVCQGTRTGGHWNKDERQAHINLLELKAAYPALQSFMNICSLTESHILRQMDTDN